MNECYYTQKNFHQDCGSPMIAKSFLDLMADFGVVCSHSRPRVSNDNPYSESQFKTLKHQPDYPGRFDSPGHALLWASDYFAWCTHERGPKPVYGRLGGQEQNNSA
jgi:putative transposase